MLHHVRRLGEALGLVAPRVYSVHLDRGFGCSCIAGPYDTREEALGHRDRLSDQDNPDSKYTVVAHKRS